MKASITHRHRGEIYTTPITLNTEPHNLKFSHFDSLNCFYLSLIRFPYKRIMQEINKTENGEIIQIDAVIRVSISKQATRLRLCVYYDVRTSESKTKYTVTKKEMHLDIKAEKEEILEVVSPYLSRLKERNTESDAKLLTSWFYRFVQPPTFESIVKKLSETQKEQAINLLCEHFGIQ